MSTVPVCGRPRVAWKATTEDRVPEPNTPSTTRFAPYLLSWACAALTALVSAEPWETVTTRRGHVPLPAMPSTGEMPCADWKDLRLVVVPLPKIPSAVVG